jgi:hypothetical protein
MSRQVLDSWTSMTTVAMMLAQLSAQPKTLIVADLELQTITLDRRKAVLYLVGWMHAVKARLLPLMMMSRMHPLPVSLADLLPQLLTLSGVERAFVASPGLGAGNRQEGQQQQGQHEKAKARRHERHCSCTTAARAAMVW